MQSSASIQTQQGIEETENDPVSPLYLNKGISERMSSNITVGGGCSGGGDTIVKELGARLLTLNRKVLEPILKDLEVANQVFSSVNASTKKALKEYVFLKRKEQIERERIRKSIEERNAQLLMEQKNRKRIQMHKPTPPPQLPTKQQQEQQSVSIVGGNSSKMEQATIIERTTMATVAKKGMEIIEQTTTAKPPLKQPTTTAKPSPSQKKPPVSVPNPTTNRRISSTTSSKSTNEKSVTEAREKAKAVETTPQKKKLEDILAMARKIRSREDKVETVAVVEKPQPEIHSTISSNEPVKQPLVSSIEEEEEPEPEEEPNEIDRTQPPEEEPKLSFVTVDERFEHYVSILKSFNELNEKADELTQKLSKKTGWSLPLPKQLNRRSSDNNTNNNLPKQPQTNMRRRYNYLLGKCLKSNTSSSKLYNDVSDFRNRFYFNEDEMQKLEKELLLNTKETRKKPELTPTHIIYSDIPNSYIGRWLPKRVNKQTAQTIVPNQRDLSKKFDKRRARFPCRLFNYKSQKELKDIYLKRFEVQQLMLKNHLYTNIFKGEFNLLNYLPQLKEEGQDDTYFKLIRCLEGIIPCEELRNENHRNIINWKSIYHFLPTNRDSQEEEEEQEDNYLEEEEEDQDDNS